MAIYDKAFEAHPVAIGKAISKMERWVAAPTGSHLTALFFFWISYFFFFFLEKRKNEFGLVGWRCRNKTSGGSAINKYDMVWHGISSTTMMIAVTAAKAVRHSLCTPGSQPFHFFRCQRLCARFFQTAGTGDGGGGGGCVFARGWKKLQWKHNELLPPPLSMIVVFVYDTVVESVLGLCFLFLFFSVVWRGARY